MRAVRGRWVPWLLASLVIGLDASSALAYCRSTTVPTPPGYDPTSVGCWSEGRPLYWKTQCPGFSVQKDASVRVSYADALSTMTAAFGAWATTTCAGTGRGPSVVAQSLGPVECNKPEYNIAATIGNANVLMFRDYHWPYSDSANTIAVTTVTYDTSTGELLDADIEVNTAEHHFMIPAFVGFGQDLLGALTHEAGHFLGMAHSNTTDATMYAYAYGNGTTMRALAKDDVGAICSVYRFDGRRETAQGDYVVSTGCDPTPKHGFVSTCDTPTVLSARHRGCDASSGGGTGGNWGLVAAVGLAVSAVARRRRRAEAMTPPRV